METDVLIVGGGIAGLHLAAKLRDHRVRVVVLESGGRKQVEDDHPLNRVVQLGDHYRGAICGRFRGLGGTSSRWGGALIPLLDHDFLARPHLGLPSWPSGMATLRRYLLEVEAQFRIDHDSYEEDFVHAIGARKYLPTGDPDFLARFAKWPAFKNRNIASLFRERLERDTQLCVWINATATRFDMDEATGRLRSVTALHEKGSAVTVVASEVTICAGAIESTRLLLLLDRQYGGRLFKSCEALGHYFYDHISAPLALIKPASAAKLNRMAGFRFVGTTMRSLRFELSPTVQATEGVPSAFGHISFDPGGATGFDALRNFLRSLQQRGRISPSLAVRILRDLPYLTRAAFWRLAYKQLYWPVPAKYELNVVAEQSPRRENQITLAAEQDIFGMALAAIDWRIREDDLKTFIVYQNRFDRFWRRHGLAAIGDLKWSLNNDMKAISTLASAADIYHPGGSTRLGSDKRSAVVDHNLRTFAVPNLFVLSTSVFPSSGSADPTLTLILLSLRLADHLATKIPENRI